MGALRPVMEGNPANGSASEPEKKPRFCFQVWPCVSYSTPPPGVARMASWLWCGPVPVALSARLYHGVTVSPFSGALMRAVIGCAYRGSGLELGGRAGLR